MTDYSPVVLRVSTVERTTVARELLHHRRAGTLDQAELDARLALTHHARTEDDLQALLCDLPDVPPSLPQATPVRDQRVHESPRAQSRLEALGATFDVSVVLLTMAAFVCTALLFSVMTGVLRPDERVAFSLAAFGSFTIGAGVVHLAHRVFRRTGQRG